MLLAILVEQVDHWDQEEVSYYLASHLCLLGLLSLMEGRSDISQSRDPVLVVHLRQE